MKNLERLALVGALAAAVFVEGSLNVRIKDLAQQRDIYQSRAANWEECANSWQLKAYDAEKVDLEAVLTAVQSVPVGLKTTYLGEFSCTAYCSEQYEHICGTGDGITASGAPVQAGMTVAADPDVLPLGSAVYIEGVGLRYVQDTGSAVKGNALDVAVDTHSEALAWPGYGTHRVWLLEVE